MKPNYSIYYLILFIFFIFSDHKLRAQNKTGKQTTEKSIKNSKKSISSTHTNSNPKNSTPVNKSDKTKDKKKDRSIKTKPKKKEVSPKSGAKSKTPVEKSKQEKSSAEKETPLEKPKSSTRHKKVSSNTLDSKKSSEIDVRSIKKEKALGEEPDEDMVKEKKSSSTEINKPKSALQNTKNKSEENNSKTKSAQPNTMKDTKDNVLEADPLTRKKLAGQDKLIRKDEKGRSLYQGSLGGTYYINSNGNKVYVDTDK